MKKTPGLILLALLVLASLTGWCSNSCPLEHAGEALIKKDITHAEFILFAEVTDCQEDKLYFSGKNINNCFTPVDCIFCCHPGKDPKKIRVKKNLSNHLYIAVRSLRL